MPETPYYLIYTSKCSPDLTELELIRILYESCSGNARVGITGVLVHKKGQFIQLLEGGKLSVMELYDKIRIDTRHFLVENIIFEGEENKVSSEFMAYRNELSTYKPAFAPFFNSDSDFKTLKNDPKTAFAFLQDIAQPVQSTKQETTYKEYKQKFFSKIKSSIKQQAN